MSKKIAFNTGRKYTVHGQRIIATLHDDGVVTFHDIDRMVCGEFKLGLHCQFNQVEVMHWYDNNLANGTARSHRDAFYHDSTNSTAAYVDICGETLNKVVR